MTQNDDTDNETRTPTGYAVARPFGRRTHREHFTVGELLQFAAELDPETRIWATEWNEWRDEFEVRPVESLSSGPGYLLLD